MASQTLVRGLSILEAVADGARDIARLSAALGTTRSTTHRLATALVQRRYLNFVARDGYSLGPKLFELGFRAQQGLLLPRVARPYLERLAAACEDTIQLGVRQEGWALCLDKIPGRRRIDISSRVGERYPVWSTGLGKALILDLEEARWRDFYQMREAQDREPSRGLDDWLARMRVYARTGVTFELEENEPEIRCVAAPIRDASGSTVAALSVSSTVAYMSEARMERLAGDVQDVADDISRALGWAGRPTSPFGAGSDR